MKSLGGKFISPVLTLGLLIFCGAVGGFQLSGGGMGPCGPSGGTLAGICFLGLPVGFLVTLVGMALSLGKTFRHFGMGERVPGENTGVGEFKEKP
jgi:hypothetical protein